MPLYEFACGSCDERFERLMSMQRADESVNCPECGSPRTRRLLSVFAAVSRGESGQTTTFAGGGCACSSGGCACGCAN